MGRGEDFVAVFSQQSLVGCHHMLPISDGFHHQVFCKGRSANDFHDDFNIRVVHHSEGITDHLDCLTHQRLGTLYIARCHPSDLNASASAAFDFFLVAF